MREREKAKHEAGTRRTDEVALARVANIVDDDVLVGCQRALLADPALVGCVIWPGGHQDPGRRLILGTEGFDGRITVEVKAGVVVLEGEVPSLGHKRLAGVLARRVSGCRAVANRLGVALHEEDSEEAVETAIRLALVRNPSIEASHIRVRVRGSTAVLEGMVDTPMQALAAENDAASVLGVERVDNRLEVDPRVRGKA